MLNLTTYLVIRVSLMDKLNPIEEINKVLNKNPYCWFGKYGEPLKSILHTDLSEKNYVLCLVYRNGAKYEMNSYKVLEISGAPKLTKSNHPLYYKSFIGRIKSFVKITSLIGPQPALEDLYLKKSLNSILKALQKSVRGHFICASKK